MCCVQSNTLAKKESESSAYWPMLLLYGFLFMEYIRPPFVPPQLTLFFALLLVFVSIQKATRSKVALPQVKLIILFNIICAASIVSGILLNQHVELHIGHAQTAFKMVFGYSVISVAMAYIVDSYKKIVHFLVAMVSLSLTVMVANLDKITQLERSGHLNLGGYFLGDGNDFALALNIVIPFAYFFLGKLHNTLTRFVFFAVLSVLILGVIFTQSRGAVLGLGTIFLFLTYASKNRARSVVILTVTFVIIISIFSATYLARMDSIANYKQDGSSMGRINAWRASIDMMKDHPFLGIGQGNFSWAYGLHYRPSDVTWRQWRTAHSAYFLVLGELGWFGLMCYIAIIYSNMKAAWQLYKNKKRAFHNSINVERLGKCLFASQIAFVVTGAFLSVAYYPHIFLLTGIIASTHKVVFLDTSE